MKTCEKCGVVIPDERLEILPHTNRCVNCSNERRKLTLMEYDHKTAPHLIVIDGNDREAIRLAKRVYYRSR